ncbi:Protein CYPRO4 [Sesbania bispinosa]|nr:Protein CYPRO4 [Sesbania bispinosa]
MFENTHGVEATKVNKLKIYGNDFIRWAELDVDDDSTWEDGEESLSKSPGSATPVRARKDLREEFEAANGGIQSLALGALDNSFLVSDNGIQIVRNSAHEIHGKGVFVNFSGGYQNGSSSSSLVLSFGNGEARACPLVGCVTGVGKWWVGGF